MSFNTAAQSGSKALLYAAPDNNGAPGSYAAVAEMDQESVDGNANPISADSHDSPLRLQYIPGRSGEDITVTCNYVPGATGQQTCRSGYLNGTPVWLQVRPVPTSGMEMYSFKSIVTKWGHQMNDNTKQSWPMSFKITGDFTVGVIP